MLLSGPVIQWTMKWLQGNEMHYLELEKEFAKFVGTKGCVTVNTGTAALHTALEALNLPPDSKILVPDFTMYATALAVYYARLHPVFVDCDADLLIDLDKAESLIDERTRVLMVTHIYGRIVDMDRVMQLAKKYNLRVIEDACEAHGATWNGKPVGSFDIGCFSFYRNKIVHGEEGGAITSDDTDLLKIAADMKSMSFGESHNFFHSQIGFNYRMTNSQAAMILDSLHEVRDNLKKRQEITSKFNSLFNKKFQMPDNRDVVWVYDLYHPRADTVIKRLKDVGIIARHSFKPMSSMPLFSYHKVNENAYLKSNEVFYLDIDVSWDDKTITQIYETTATIMEEEL